MKNIISIVTPIYDRLDHFRLMLRGFPYQTNFDFELIVVDDGGPSGTALQEILDRTRDALANVAERKNVAAPTVKYLFLSPYTAEFRAGLARNYGVSESCGKRIVFLDSDCIPGPDLVERYHKYLDKPDVIAGALRNISFGDALKADMPINSMTGTPDRRPTIYPTVGRKLMERMSVETDFYRAFWTGNMSVPTKEFEEIGGFWEDIRGYGAEDQEIAYRLWTRGCPLRIDLRIYSVHVDHPAGKNLRGADAWRRTQEIMTRTEQVQPVRPGRFLPRRQHVEGS